ncbi:hypothetical protein ACLB1T_22220 [Escherichia coli]
MSWQEKINAALDARRAADALRRRYPVAQGAGRWLVADDRQYLKLFQSFRFKPSSANYPCLAAGCGAIWRRSGGSGHVSGYSVAHQALKRAGRVAGLFWGTAIYLWFCR